MRALKESDAYPAMAERGYGWEKLISEMFCEEYWAERGMKTAIARFHNVYGPWGTWDGGREKAPAAICRKVITAMDTGKHNIMIWGDGTPTRSFMYIDDCVKGIDMIMHSDALIATPINLGTSELVTVNELVSKVEKIAGVKLKREYDLTAPRGVAGRNSDNTFIKKSAPLGAEYPAGRGPARHLQVDQDAVRRQEGGQAGSGLTRSCLGAPAYCRLCAPNGLSRQHAGAPGLLLRRHLYPVGALHEALHLGHAVPGCIHVAGGDAAGVGRRGRGAHDEVIGAVVAHNAGAGRAE